MKNIVVALDGSAPSMLALGWARELAKSSPSATFHLVYAFQVPISAIEAGLVISPQTLREMKEQGEAMLRQAAASLAGVSVKLHVFEGSPGMVILELAEDVGADLIAMGRRGVSRMKGMLVGSVSQDVVERAKVPVLVVHDAAPHPVRNVLVGVDGSEHSVRSLGVAVTVVPDDAQVVALHVMQVAPEAVSFFQQADIPLSAAADRTALELLTRTAARAEVPVGRCSALGLIGSPAEQLVLEYRTGAYDLAVVGSRGHGRLSDLLLGSVSERMLRLAPGPVLVVK